MFVLEKVFLGRFALLFIVIAHTYVQDTLTENATFFKRVEVKKKNLSAEELREISRENQLVTKMKFRATMTISTNILNDVYNICTTQYSAGHIKFYLFTKMDADHKLIYKKVSLDDESIIFPPDNDGNLKIMIHGEHGSRNDGFNVLIRDAYFSANNERNILVVDYSYFGNSVDYMERIFAHKTAKLVAKCIIPVLDKITKDNAATIKDLHIVSFGFGCHIAGFLAYQIKINKQFYPKIERITALSPTLRHFEDKESLLTKYSASIVDVMYTNSGTHGQIKPIGTHSFYANGGLSQPNCKEYDDVGYRCSHKRAYMYFAESIMYTNSLTGFLSTKRGPINMIDMSIGQFDDSVGNIDKFQIGEYMASAQYNDNKIFFFETNGVYPFAKNMKNCVKSAIEEKFILTRNAIDNMIDSWKKAPLMPDGGLTQKSFYFDGVPKDLFIDVVVKEGDDEPYCIDEFDNE